MDGYVYVCLDKGWGCHILVEATCPDEIKNGYVVKHVRTSANNAWGRAMSYGKMEGGILMEGGRDRDMEGLMEGDQGSQREPESEGQQKQKPAREQEKHKV